MNKRCNKENIVNISSDMKENEISETCELKQTVFSRWKLLEVLQKAVIKILACGIYT